MVKEGRGKTVKTWKTGKTNHFNLALEPFGRSLEIINAIRVPKYGYWQDQYDEEQIKLLLFSIPACFGWWTIWLSAALWYPLSRGSLRNKTLTLLLKTGSIFMLIAVPLLCFDFYKSGISYFYESEVDYGRYFHIGVGAYLIVASYLLTGIGVLFLIKFNATQKSSK